jgi:hypothetical protein
MIVSQITDGLGNQLFQYAAARRLAIRWQTDLKLDVLWYKKHKHRQFELDRFQITVQPARLADIAAVSLREAVFRGLPKMLGRQGARIPLAMMRRCGKSSQWFSRTFDGCPQNVPPSLFQGRIVSERCFHFDSQVLQSPDRIAMCGYWQSEKYFVDVALQIRRELTVKSRPEGKNAEYFQKIASSNSVSVHVRRGDKTNWAMFPCTTAQFCITAMQWMKQHVNDARFFVFSDDPNWARQNLNSVEDLLFVDHNANDAVEDLRLMSLCRHNIIAPSSFSWWGAWLNSHPSKIVVSPHPRNWISHPQANPKDVLPKDWVILDEAHNSQLFEAIPIA